MSELADLASQCIRCGFCLESCPTFAISGDETESPRGRIYLIRSLDEGVIRPVPEVLKSLDTCIGCRACETACPSGVRFGEIIEQARARFRRRLPLRFLVALMSRPKALAAIGMLQPLHKGRMPKLLAKSLSRESPVVRLPIRRRKATTHLPKCDRSVHVLEGCAMSVFFGDVNAATESLLHRIGFDVQWVRGCCGALHSHNGFSHQGAIKAKRILAQAGEVLVTNSGGCGSHLLGRSGGQTNVCDITDFLFKHDLKSLLEQSNGLPNVKVAYQESCHLTHGMGVRVVPKELLKSIPGIELVEMSGSDYCCGSGGVYNVLQPNRSQILQRNLADRVEETGASVMVSGNPGCLAWMEQIMQERGGSVQVLHTLSLLEASFTGSLEKAVGKRPPAL